jgi:hypothetical protein
MILIDSSVWIDLFARRITPETRRLLELRGGKEIGVADLAVAEVLQGFREDRRFEIARRSFSELPVLRAADHAVAEQSARYYRQLRALGITIRGTIDCIIATRCIIDGHSLLARDRDFLPFVTHFGLRLA